MKVRDFIVEKIKKLYDEMGCEALIEIGLGKGVLTKKLSQITNHFFVVEKDEKLANEWNGKRGTVNGNVIISDVLEVDVRKMLETKKLDPRKTLIVGNLPYYITSPIFRKFFTEDVGRSGSDNVGRYTDKFPGGIFMVQDEVAQRISEDKYGRCQKIRKSYLRRLLNYGYEVKYLKGVPAKAFKPVPNVKSAVVQLTTKSEKLTVKFDKLLEFLDLYNGFPRKTLGKIEKMVNKKLLTLSKNSQKSSKNSQKKFVIPEELKKRRLEELGREEMREILK